VAVTAALLATLAVLAWPSGNATTTPSEGVRLVGPGRPRRRLLERVVLGLRLRPGISRAAPWVADFAEVVAVGLAAGLDLGSATVASARSPGVAEQAPWLHARLRRSVDQGLPASACLEPPDTAPPAERRDLTLLAAAWRLAEEAGAAASEVTAAAADAVRARRAADERAAVLAAGPRASMWLLTSLPLGGPVAGALVGVGPDRLFGTAAGRTCAVAGLVFTASGWCWSRTLLARARQPGRTSGGSSWSR
jgi:tight adherence protein B